MDSYPLVSVVTATLNESGNLRTFIERVRKALGGVTYEVVVVDDNSSDGTIELLEKVQNSNTSLRIIVNPHRLGLLASNLTGLMNSTGEMKIVMDADLQHPPEKIGEMIKALSEGNDLVVMSRFVDGSQVGRRNAYRNSITSTAIALCHMMVPQTRGIRDPISGFFGIGRNAVIPYEKLFGALGNRRGYKILVPVLACNSGKRIVEIPYEFGERLWGESKIGKENFLIPRYLSELGRYRSLFRENAS